MRHNYMEAENTTINHVVRVSRIVYWCMKLSLHCDGLL